MEFAWFNHIKNIGELSHLYTVSVAYCTAYLAFDHFKYRKRIDAIVEEYTRNFDVFTEHAQEVIRDKVRSKFFKAIQVISNHFKEFKSTSSFSKFIFVYPPANDKRIVCFFAVLNVIYLVASNIFTLKVQGYSLLLYCGVPIAGIFVSSMFTLNMNKIIKDFDKTLSLTYDAYEETVQQRTELSTMLAAMKMSILDLTVSLFLYGLSRDQLDGLKDLLKQNMGIESIKRFVNEHALLKTLKSRNEFNGIFD